MADRSVLGSNTFEVFRTTFNSLSADVGDIASVTSASGTIASATDIVEAVVQLNAAVFDPSTDITFSVDNTYSGTANFTSTVTMSGTKNFTGTTNLAGLVFSTSGITFADGTSQTTAATSQAFAISMAVALG